MWTQIAVWILACTQSDIRASCLANGPTSKSIPTRKTIRIDVEELSCIEGLTSWEQFEDTVIVTSWAKRKNTNVIGKSRKNNY